jgi:hypothetical protein
MPAYVFTITLRGVGNNPEEAWDKAVEAFVDEPGEFDDYHLVFDGNDEPAIEESSIPIPGDPDYLKSA